MASTLLLDQTLWDLVTDANGNIAMADEPYAISQDVASAIRTFLGECWFNTTDGVPYWSDILGQQLSLQVVKKAMIDAAMTVQGVVSAQCYITGFDGRVLTGQVQVTTSAGVTLPVNF